MEKLTVAQSIILSRIKIYIKRQHIVLDAIRYLRPEKVMRYEQKGHPEQWSKMRIQNMKKSQAGEWKQADGITWDYFLHGNGCRLTQSVTGERIDWDVGPINKFDKFWFFSHVTWHMENEDAENLRQMLATHSLDNAPISEVQVFVFTLLDQLRDLGYLSEQPQNRYMLVGELE